LPGRFKLPRHQRHEPIVVALPRALRDRPLLLGATLAVTGLGVCTLIITTMADWPRWLIFPSMFIAVPALVATVIGLSMLVVLGFLPLLERRDLGWDDEPLATLGIPLALQRKCEALGYWTCVALSEAIEKGIFPWTELEYDERMQVQRLIELWRAQTEKSKALVNS
jgi:hypothetical protein